MKLKQEFLDEWLRRLRSGKYTQRFHGLMAHSDPLARCAIGVLLNEEDVKDGKSIKNFKSHYHMQLVYNGHTTSVVELNDIWRLSFEQIANILEENQRNNSFERVLKKLRAEGCLNEALT